MLDKALKFEKAFTRMYLEDQKYQKYCREISTIRGNPSTDDWKNVKAFVKFLNIFYQTTLKFLGSLYATSNSFFHEFFNLRNDIIKYTKSDDLTLVDMAKRMKSKLEKYWGKFESMNMLLIIAVVLDPRYKMKYVNYILSIAYGDIGITSEPGDLLQSQWEKYIEEEGNSERKSDLEIYLIDDVYTKSDDLTLVDMAKRMKSKLEKYWGKFESMNMLLIIAVVLDPRYKMKYVNYILSIAYGDIGITSEPGDLLQSQWEKYMEEEGNSERKSDLEIYLIDDVVKIKDFNILSWWKASSSKYPIVSKIARNVLSIPISIVASESAFSTGGRILDTYRSSLSQKTVEALICTQQWIRLPSKECKFEDLLEEVQKLEEIEEEYPDSPLRID
uniref:Zinc finger BED domain-containing protein RICESLEEPER 1-like n=1 Tax=Nicotiana sylvestris TaxID=4096 RepID=A0A1U7UYG9_NICSY|nr:PREDICTED: zinc finger BED domain-containing protein RICESLEEPER 1-like [Nicotiana sylvestris]